MYRTLDHWEEERLVATDHEQIVDGRVRRYYRITDEGTDAAQAEAARLQRAVNLVSGRVAVTGA
ncbi:helix-turn-helix transcriptional regulator [Streptosporangium subroseum]|uniref:PadR family transcriptional regulator n=1 Tax=Streptosporangium subroseum TaxID=106412 RepID=UPI00343F7FE8